MRVSSAERPTGVYTVAQVRAMDRTAIERHRIPGYELMTRAAMAALGLIRTCWPDTRSIRIFCGAGNNAGDGYVLARLAVDAGYAVEVLAVTAPARLHGDAATAVRDAERAGIRIDAFDARARAPADLTVDALLGTGLDRALDGPYRLAVEAINASAGPVLALDVPTGLDADTGAVRGTAVRATATITFVGQKAGLFLGVAPDYCGDLAFDGLGIPAAVAAAEPPVLERLTTTELAAALPRRRRSAHKGTHGRLLLVGGGPGMGGAIRLAAEAALRAGAGLVNVATHPQHVAAVIAGRPEIICRGVLEVAELIELVAAADAIVLGPGLGQSDWARPLWRSVLELDKPAIVDADGLNLLALDPRARGRWVLTPHPGEAARLLGASVAEIEADRLAAVRAIAARYEAVTVLKGARTLVAAPDAAAVAVCDAGNPGMATAGMGDVLSGVIGAIAVQTGALVTAARTGVLVHALAGDSATVREGERGLIASDLLPHIRRLVNSAPKPA